MDIKGLVERDLDDLASKYLQGINFKITKEKSPFEQLLKFKHWIIEDRPRKISFSQSFLIPPQYKTGLDLIVHKIENGIGEIYRHQSRRLFNGNGNDPMLCDFGIHHLHLGTEDDPKHQQMINGTEKLVFVYINDEEAFFIKVDEHEKWHLQDFLKIIHCERPDLIRHRIIPTEEGDEYTDDEIKSIRRMGFNYILKIEGQSYKSESLVTLSGFNSEITIYSYYLRDKVEVELHNCLIKFFNYSKDDEVNFKNIRITDFDFILFKYFRVSTEVGTKTIKFKIKI